MEEGARRRIPLEGGRPVMKTLVLILILLANPDHECRWWAYHIPYVDSQGFTDKRVSMVLRCG